MPEDGSSWLERYERAGWLERIGLLGGGAVRVTANLIEGAIDRAAKTVVEAEAAFRRELDPNVSDAKVIEEWEEPPRDRRTED